MAAAPQFPFIREPSENTTADEEDRNPLRNFDTVAHAIILSAGYRSFAPPIPTLSKMLIKLSLLWLKLPLE